MKKAEESTVPTNNKKVEVHDATEKTTDITPKQTETEHEKQVLTGTLAQKAAQVAQALTKKAFGERDWHETLINGQKVIPGMAENSELARENHEIARDEFSDAPDRRAFGYMAPKVLGGAGNLIGGRLGGAVGKLTGQGLGIATELGTALDNSARRRYATEEDAGPRLPAPAAPKPAPQLPVGQPRPPVAQPPRGLGSAGLNKAGAFAFDIGSSLLNKRAENFRGFQPPKPGTPFRIVDRSASGPKNDVPSWNDLPGNRPSPQATAAKSPPMASVPQQKQPPMVSIPQRAATGGAYPPLSPAGSNNNAASYDPPMPASAPRRPASALTLENILPGSGLAPVRKAVEGATGGVVADSPQGSMWNQLRSDIGSAFNKAGALDYGRSVRRKQAEGNPELYARLMQHADQNTGSAFPMSNSNKPLQTLPPDLVQMLQKYMQLPEGQVPDEIDAAGAMMDLKPQAAPTAAR